MSSAVAVVLVVAFLLFIWKRTSLGTGRKYGNEIAAHLNMSKNFFHTVLENGVDGPSLRVLTLLQGMNLSLHEASVQLAPSLERGLVALETRFGHQAVIEEARPVIVSLMREWDQIQSQS